MTAPVPAPASRIRTVDFADLLSSEWTRLRTVRSTYITALLASVGTVVIAIAICLRYVQEYDQLSPDDLQSDLTNFSLTGVYLAQVALGALGVLVVSSEYGTGMIRATFTAVPQRRLVLAARGLVLASATVLLGEVSTFTAFSLGQTILSSKHIGTSLADPGVLRAVVGAGLYLSATALLGFGLGALLRHTAGALSAFFGLLYAPTALIDLLPTDWRNDVINYMPVNAGSQIMTVVHTGGALGAWTGFGVFLCYPAAALIGALILVERRDV
ncbi:MAG TPA: ABC transporter permease [Actinocrinis sp.]|nr:ABC transporter permease [Actinocrinis sp.]